MTYEERRRWYIERKWEMERRQQPVLHYTDNGWTYIKKPIKKPTK